MADDLRCAACLLGFLSTPPDKGVRALVRFAETMFEGTALCDDCLLSLHRQRQTATGNENTP